MTSHDMKDKFLKAAIRKREGLKAQAMRGRVPLSAQDVGDTYSELARNAKEEPSMQHSENREAITAPLEDIERLAFKLARNMPVTGGNALVRKLKSLDAKLQSARTKNEIYYVLARGYPRLENQVKSVINLFLTDCYEPWDIKCVKLAFHWMRVFYEAKKDGFPLGEEI